MKITNLIQQGSLLTVPNFLADYIDLENKIKDYEYEATHQPKSVQYGNRFQAAPCWETQNLKSLIDLCTTLSKNKLRN